MSGNNLRNESTGIAKPIFCASPRMAVLIPINSPRMFSSGPPLLPGLMLASVWIKSRYDRRSLIFRVRSVALMIPVVTVWW